jgi:single-stranded-DNA-specific exonuclease
VDEVKHANEKGIDVIITDHHEPHEVLPEACAILNSKQKDCNYVDKNLCGSGVIFKLTHLLIEEARNRKYNIAPGYEKWLLDMTGLATISDMVPLIGENRVLAYYGLKVLQKNKRRGLFHLLNKLKINEKYLDEGDIGFSVSPCINAASRMNHAYDAFNLLSTDDENEAIRLADELIRLNKLRKSSAENLISDIKGMIDVDKVEDKVENNEDLSYWKQYEEYWDGEISEKITDITEIKDWMNSIIPDFNDNSDEDISEETIKNIEKTAKQFFNKYGYITAHIINAMVSQL